MKLNQQPSVVDGPHTIHGVEFKEGRNGEYANFLMSDNSGTVKATKWQLTKEEKEILQNHDVLHINGKGGVSSYSGAYEINVTFLNPTEDYNLDDITNNEPVDALALFNGLIKIVERFNNGIIKDVTLKALNTYKTELLIVSAAKRIHHDKPKGLIRHITEMIKLGLTIQKMYPEANSELIVSGIIFHDLMKIKEYNFTSFGAAKEFTADGVLFGHVHMGAKLPGELASVEDKNSEEIRMLEHIILSHHGLLEYGSPVTPATIEAIIVNMADNMDAEVYKYSAATQKLEKGEMAYDSNLRKNIYRSSL